MISRNKKLTKIKKMKLNSKSQTMMIRNIRNSKL